MSRPTKKYRVTMDRPGFASWEEIVEATCIPEALILSNKYHPDNTASHDDVTEYVESSKKPSNTRITKKEYACLLALAASYRSCDPFTAVGCAAFDKDGYTIGTAYNGLAPGMETPEWMNLEENRTRKSLLFQHAEINLLTKLNGRQPYSIGLTHNPCAACAKVIVASGIKQVYYISEYERGGKDWMDVFDFYSVKYEKVILSVKILKNYE